MSQYKTQDFNNLKAIYEEYSNGFNIQSTGDWIHFNGSGYAQLEPTTDVEGVNAFEFKVIKRGVMRIRL